jgi:hypothetical protein
MTMWTGDLEDEEEEGAADEERSERVVAMRDGTRNENATRWWGAIETDVNEDNVAPWKVDVDGMGSGDNGCACADPEEEGCGRGAMPVLGMNDVTTATGCAVSRRSARIFWERPRALILLLAARSKEDQRFAAVAVASATAKRDIMRPAARELTVSYSSKLMFVPVRDGFEPTHPVSVHDLGCEIRATFEKKPSKGRKDGIVLALGR